MAQELGKYYIYDVPKGSPKYRQKFFRTYKEAQEYCRTHKPEGAPKGVFHIYPVDKSGYAGKKVGRTSFGEGNRQWERQRMQQRRP